MDDNDLMTAVREPFARILMTTPVESVVTRGSAYPLGLQHALRAHGVAAIVRFHRAGSLMPGCVIPGGSRLAQTYHRVFVQQPAGGRGGALLYIDPAAVASAAEIGIDAARGSGFGIELLTRHGPCLPPSNPSTVRIGPS